MKVVNWNSEEGIRIRRAYDKMFVDRGFDLMDRLMMEGEAEKLFHKLNQADMVIDAMVVEVDHAFERAAEVVRDQELEARINEQD